MIQMPGVDLAERFFSGTGSTYDLMVNLCTFGFDLWWKRQILEKVPEGSRRIVDQACGTGILTFKLARRFPLAHVVGVELRKEYLDIARQKAQRLGWHNVRFFLGRAEDVRPEGRFDCIISSYLAKYADLDRLVAGAAEMLRDGGLLIMHDFNYPPNPRFAALWELYFRLLQAFGSPKYPQWKTIFRELPELIRETGWQSELIHALRRSHFCRIRSEHLTFGTSTIIWAQR